MAYNELTAYIQKQLKSITNDILAAENAYLLGFFGSVEAVKENAHFYVFEEEPHYSFDEENMKFRIETSYRIRLKTEEEMENH